MDNLNTCKMGMTPEHKRLYREIDEILWNDWDPIGLKGNGPRDEYESYVNVIFSQAIKKGSQKEIAEKLFELESVTIGVSGSMDHCLQIAKKIIALR